MDDEDCYEIISIGSEETISERDFAPGAPSQQETREQPLEATGPLNNDADDSISAPSTSRTTNDSGAAAGFLILNWRSPATPSHVSWQCLSILRLFGFNSILRCCGYIWVIGFLN